MRIIFVILSLSLFLFSCASKMLVSLDSAGNSDASLCNYDAYIKDNPGSIYKGKENILIHELKKRGVSEQDCINLIGRKGIYAFADNNKYKSQIHQKIKTKKSKVQKDKIKRLIDSKLPNCSASASIKMTELNNCFTRIIYKNGSEFQGEIQNGVFHGKGIFKYPSSDILESYKGDFKYGYPDGKGINKFRNGDLYQGEVKKGGAKHGYGTYIFKNGGKYVGYFKDDFYHGNGLQTFKNGNKYNGYYKNGKYHGNGVFRWKSGAIFSGEYINGFEVYGTYIFPDGSRYTGEFKNQKFNGEGIFTEINGKVKEGIWKDNKFVTNQKIKKILKHKQSKFKKIVKSKTELKFSTQPIDLKFKSTNQRPDDVAVIIGNANYEKQGKDIPNVKPAYADAEGMKNYFTQALGVKEGNIIYLKDATAAQLLTVFGNQNNYKGQLYNWVKPNVSKVYVYYAGHGVPGGLEGNAYLVPADANAQSISLSGYPLFTLYSNLGKIPAKSITVFLEACFSGASQAGNLFSKSSPIVITAKKTMIPKNVKVISAGAVDQMASWEQDNSHGLFTKYFLKAMSGEGDKNKDGKVSDFELKNYLDDTMTYFARRYYGRDQNVQIMQGNY